jgi:hypothetical protein
MAATAWRKRWPAPITVAAAWWSGSAAAAMALGNEGGRR